MRLDAWFTAQKGLGTDFAPYMMPRLPTVETATVKNNRKGNENGELLLQALRGEVFEREFADGSNLSAPPGRQSQGAARTLRGRRKIAVHLQVLRTAVFVDRQPDGSNLSASPERQSQGQTFARAVSIFHRSGKFRGGFFITAEEVRIRVWRGRRLGICGGTPAEKCRRPF